MRTATCHPERAYRAKGLCSPCYSVRARSSNSRKATCHPDRPHSAKGYCAPCARWRKHVFKTYGLTPEQYEEMAAKQGGVCAICGEPSATKLQVDHDHVTGAIRALLCIGCNGGLGNFKDNIALLSRAAAYLKTHSAAGLA